MYSHQYPGVHDEDQLLRAACASSVRKACAKRTARFTRAAGCNRNLSQHTRLSQTTHSCDSEAQLGSCIAHLNATLMSESV